MILNSLPSTLTSDVCIFGSGPAGIITALEISKNKSVLLIEAGGYENSGLDFFKAEEHGIKSLLHANRLRVFGGTSGHWEGWCSRLDKEDFEIKNQLEDGWPIDYEELLKYYLSASKYLKIDLNDDNSQYISLNENLKIKGFSFSSPVVRFGETFKSQLTLSSNIKLVLNAPLINLSLDKDSSSIISATVSKDMKNTQILAKHFILACGGIENARLLLNFQTSNNQSFGKGHRHIGQGFMDHPHFYNVGHVISIGHETFRNGILTDQSREEHKVQYFFQLSKKLKKKFNLSNALLRVHKANPQDDFETNIINTIKDNFGYEDVTFNRLVLMAEQIYSPSINRIELISSLDKLGLRKCKLHWTLTEEDWRSYLKTMDLFAREIGAYGMGYIKINNDFINKSIDPAPGPHHMGTTRMAKNPEKGVVDSNLSVFGIKNLSVIGSSVFPSGGAANPTLTICALAIRLANFINNITK